MSKIADSVTFETAFSELETIVNELEKGQLGLDKSLEQFERGIELTRHCESKLGQAEQHVVKVLADGEGSQEVPFEPETDG